MICFTGSTATGRLVAIEAAKNLTPCLLELGGKCPAIVDETANIENAVKRILFGKFVNCGQTCVGVDHVYVHSSIAPQFKIRLLDVVRDFYGSKNLKDSGDYAKIINQFHYDRLQNYLSQKEAGEILYQGDSDRNSRFMGPVVLNEPHEDSLVMTEEIFGPILPIRTYETV